MNLKSKINKLQQALRVYGKVILINRHQVYIKDKDRVCTLYVVTEPKEITQNDGTVKKKNVPLFQTYSQVEVVKRLAELVKEVQGG